MVSTPETLTAAKRAEQLNLGTNGAAPPPQKTDSSSVSTKNDKYAAVARQALSLTPARNETANLDPHEDIDQSFMILGIHEIEPYKHNPRTGPNPLYKEIKASIRADGITNTLTVTRAPNSMRYSPYGGGNTRLQIAKELYEEGDQRFARLNVVVKKWSGDANVISAHLAENENRGDISFWEKAQGVNAFKIEFDRENGKLLTAGELNKELRQRGINFGIKVIQNFAFSVEYLEPLGPWLKATDVNTIIRPGVAGLLELAGKLEKTREVTDSIQTVLQNQANHLKALQAKNEELDPGDQVVVALDATQLTDALQAAAAQVVGCTQAAIAVMLSALAANSQITADALRQVKVNPAFSTPSSQANRDLQGAAKQRPLPGMLAQVPPLRTPTVGGTASAPDSDIPPPVGGAAPTPPRTAEASHSADDPANPVGNILQILIEINDLVTLSDVTLSSPSMPFGYLMDIPPSILEVDGQPVPEPELRAAVWKLLATVSGQLDHRTLKAVSPTHSTWVALVRQGPAAFEQAYAQQIGGHIFDKTPYMALSELSWVLAEADIGYLFIKLMQAMEQVRVSHPERFPSDEPTSTSQLSAGL